ncbi:Resolvase protein homolog ResB [Propionibacterium freudenreichii]|uniref:recombinase family protein n=1 Tax=Propionibacterium freudenreichii TaxID=1744 RepID=UPI000543B825|nr:recombinase family protein [Propionibacterium freudenreichii]CEG87489.1 Resolvase protein homolog ResB [Propionibacterium freudenreichii]
MAPQGQVVGYVRVSSKQQNLARQLESIGEVDRLFQDKVSGGSRTARVGLAECLKYIRDGDTVRVASMDRLARSLVDLQQIVDEILQKGAAVHFVKEGQTYSPSTDDSMSRLLLQILGAFAEFERNLIRERQAEGIAVAKKAGKYKGRSQSLSSEQIQQARNAIDNGIPLARVARDLNVNRATLYRAFNRVKPTTDTRQPPDAPRGARIV